MSNAVTTLKVSKRERAGTGGARATRREGLIPGVIYGDNKASVIIALQPIPLQKELQKRGFFTSLFDLEIDNKKERVLPRDVQYHPVADTPVHVDFLRVSDRTIITVSVPLIYKDETKSPGMKKGGVLNLIYHDLSVQCRADSIPHSFEISLDGKEIGDTIAASDVKLPSGIKLAGLAPTATIASITVPRTEEEVAAAAATPAEGEAAAAAPAAGAAGAKAGDAKAAAPAKDAKK